jgi:hypothetical protein
MTKAKKTNYYLLFIVYCVLFIVLPTQSQNKEPEITLTWSANSYVTLNYPGKALPIKGSLIEVVAVLESTSINPQNLNYYWYLDKHLQREKSGTGKQVFKFEATKGGGQIHQVKVWVKDQEGTLFLQKTISIKIVSPQIILYQTNQITPIFPNQATQTAQVQSGEKINFTALPYFFNIKDTDELNYQWNFGTEKPTSINSKNPNIFALKIGQVAKTITQHLRLWVENKNNPSQRTETQVKITIIP